MRALLLAVALWAGLCSGANILVMMPLSTFSHTNAFIPVFEELARRGHNVTVVSPFPREKPIPNYTDFVVTNTFEKLLASFKMDMRDLNTFTSSLIGTGIICPSFLDVVLELPEVKYFINEDKSHFDLVITETWFCQEPFTALAHKYSAHLVAIQPLLLGSVESMYTGNPLPYSIMPQMKVVATDHMSFKERLLSTIIYTSELLLHKLVFLRSQENYMRQHFRYPGSESLPPLSDLLYNHSLVLLDNHLALSYPKAFFPNVVEFGGLSAKNAKPLPKDLEDYMSGAKDGVIFLSWGSHYKSTNMKPDVLAKFLSAFSKLKQRVLMKWENPELPGKPANVRIAPWFPQASILAHPKLVAFISHGGVHGVSEAMYNAVPILGTPRFADQYMNIKICEQAGFSISLEIEDATEEELVDSVKKLIYDPKYKKAALRRSAIFKDRPISGLDNAAYWVEYVLRHDGARHLRPASLELYWYQYYLLDIIGLAVGALLILIFAVVCIVRILCCRSKAKPQPKKKPKKE